MQHCHTTSNACECHRLPSHLKSMCPLGFKLHPSAHSPAKTARIQSHAVCSCPNAQGIPDYMPHAQAVRQSSILGHSSMHPEHALPGMVPKVLCCLGCPRLLGMHMPTVLDASMAFSSPCASVVQEAHIDPCLMLACMGRCPGHGANYMLSFHGLAQHIAFPMPRGVGIFQGWMLCQPMDFPALRCVEGSFAPHYCKVKNLSGCGKLNLPGSPSSFLMFGGTQAIGCGNPTLSWLFYVVFSLQSKKPFGLWKVEPSWLTQQLSHVWGHTGYRLWQPYTVLAVPSYGHALAPRQKFQGCGGATNALLYAIKPPCHPCHG